MPSPTLPDLLALLGTGAEPSQEELARRLRVSTRTVRRLLHRLERGGAVEVWRDGLVKRYRLAPGHRPLPPPPVALTEAEAEAVTVAVLAARGVLAPTPFASDLTSAVAKLQRSWLEEALTFEPEAEPLVWDFDDAVDGAPPAPFDPRLFRDLLRAVRERLPVDADYYTASRLALSTGRRLHPLGVLVRRGAWLLAAFCGRDGRVKDYALGGFRAVALLEGERFEPPEGFDLRLHAGERFGALAGDDVHVVRLLVDAEAAPYFHRRAYHRTQVVEEALPDGGLVVSLEVEGLDDVAAFVRSWGPRLRVAEPAALADRVAEDARATLARYERPPTP